MAGPLSLGIEQGTFVAVPDWTQPAGAAVLQDWRQKLAAGQPFTTDEYNAAYASTAWALDVLAPVPVPGRTFTHAMDTDPEGREVPVFGFTGKSFQSGDASGVAGTATSPAGAPGGAVAFGSSQYRTILDQDRYLAWKQMHDVQGYLSPRSFVFSAAAPGTTAPAGISPVIIIAGVVGLVGIAWGYFRSRAQAEAAIAQAASNTAQEQARGGANAASNQAAQDAWARAYAAKVHEQGVAYALRVQHFERTGEWLPASEVETQPPPVQPDLLGLPAPVGQPGAGRNPLTGEDSSTALWIAGLGLVALVTGGYAVSRMVDRPRALLAPGSGLATPGMVLAGGSYGGGAAGGNPFGR